MKWIPAERNPLINLYVDESDGRIVGFIAPSTHILDNKVDFVPYMAFHERRHIGDFTDLGYAIVAVEKMEKEIKAITGKMSRFASVAMSGGGGNTGTGGQILQ